MAIDMAIGIVIHDAPGRAHNHHSTTKNAQIIAVGESATG
jgi:hypothetical protein